MPRVPTRFYGPSPLRLAYGHLRAPSKLRFYSSGPPKTISEDIAALLDKPTWSVRSLIPSNDALENTPSVSPEKLRHLLRLSALPEPVDEAEEASMLKILESQIHFVREIQRVDAKDVPPLRAIRDESQEAMEESTIGLQQLKDALAKEKVVGRRNKIQRVETENDTTPDSDQWDGNALGAATKSIGKYFVVQNRS
ncbi:hypothetical protein PISL3812_05951 [Talaromyces islandicus]|uniref:Glutamyl-tRNA amidotransferase complex subunit Gta3 domain-containing protein n=1 Tax=Talaromyces islandicus TaxID=28573 RepID=A0A0U1M197_TALIS|nr:hypothetical protein PISL3812_05951 [Talaromyces islandicus]